MNKRKYVGVPTQQEIIQQYEELVSMTKAIKTYDDIQQFLKENPHNGSYVEVEINYNSIKEYKNEPVEVIRYEYKNLLVYVNIKNGKAEISEYVTLYDDNGSQYAEEKYNDYDKEIQRVADMGHLELIE